MAASWIRSLPIPFIGANRPVVAVVRLSGVIASGGRFGGGVNLTAYGPALERAFAPGRLDAVALVINSPGGSPVQSSLIVKRVRALAQERAVPVFAFVEDVAASGGYMLACAADEIFADESSIVGSIGVISAGFGYQGLIEKLGVERRVHASGIHKDALDPFRPEREDDVSLLKALQAEVHETFKELVRARRGTRLKGPEPELFSGAFWIGTQAVKLGLVDGIGDLRGIMRRRFGDKVRLVPVAAERRWWQRAGGFSGEGPSLGGLALAPERLLDAIDARALWARFGL